MKEEGERGKDRRKTSKYRKGKTAAKAAAAACNAIKGLITVIFGKKFSSESGFLVARAGFFVDVAGWQLLLVGMATAHRFYFFFRVVGGSRNRK